MKSLYAALAAGTILSAAAMAQDDHIVTFDKMVPQIRVMGLQGSMMGKTVKGAPYSAVEVNESSQMLADGTRIHNESQTQVYRDTEGRLRRETSSEITIWDPVANASWVLNPKDKTARKLPMGNFVFNTVRTANGEVSTYMLKSDAEEKGLRAAAETRVVEQKLAVARDADPAKIKAELEAHMRQTMPAGGGIAMAASAGPNGEIKRIALRQKGTTEQLGKRTMEGVTAEGTRLTSTIEAGAIGNDRPINTVTERWFSPDLQTWLLVRTTDPRSGEESFKLVNVNRSEPAAYLFQVPAGYQVVEPK